MTRHPVVRLVAQAIVAGAVGSLFTNGAWLIITGHPAPFLASLLMAETVTSAWGLVQAIRFRRKWQAVLASYNRPALGEGIDIPGWPPADDKDNDR